jgi:hypothetical protein
MLQSTVWSHATQLPAEPTSASRARDFVCKHLVEHQLLYLVEDVRLVASEMATIAMGRSPAPFTLTLERVDGLVRITVTEGSSSLPDGWGHGLSMVQVVSQDCGVRVEDSGSRSLWASFMVRSRFPAASGLAGP